MTRRNSFHLALGLCAAFVARAAAPATSFHFDFGAGPATAGHIKVASDAVYSKEAGYGFDMGTKPSPLDWGVTGPQPFFFSVALPEGNYRVTVGPGRFQRSLCHDHQSGVPPSHD